jgi:hypothetical protein
MFPMLNWLNDITNSGQKDLFLDECMVRKVFSGILKRDETFRGSFRIAILTFHMVLLLMQVMLSSNKEITCLGT